MQLLLHLPHLLYPIAKPLVFALVCDQGSHQPSAVTIVLLPDEEMARADQVWCGRNLVNQDPPVIFVLAAKLVADRWQPSSELPVPLEEFPLGVLRQPFQRADAPFPPPAPAPIPAACLFFSFFVLPCQSYLTSFCCIQRC